MNQSDPQGTAVFMVVRAGVAGDVTVQWSLGPEAAENFYQPLYGSLYFPIVIIHSICNDFFFTRRRKFTD